MRPRRRIETCAEEHELIGWVLSTVFNVLFYGFTFFVAFVAWGLCQFASRHTVWRWLKFWGWVVVWMARIILFARIEVRGREHLDPTRPQLIVSKHQSELDIVMLAYVFFDISAVAMAELTKLPFFGKILKTLDVVLIAVDSGPQGRTEQAISGGKRMADEGRSMVIFPEGELMKLGARERYKRGVYHMYQGMGVEVVPAAVSLGVIWPQRRWVKNIGMTGAVEYMKPIPPGLPMEEFMAAIEEQIEDGSMALLREHASGDILQAAERRYTLRLNNFDTPAGQDAPAK